MVSLLWGPMWDHLGARLAGTTQKRGVLGAQMMSLLWGPMWDHLGARLAGTTQRIVNCVCELK